MNLLKYSLVLIFLLSSFINVQAQEKYGYVDSNILLSQMAAFKAVEKEIETFNQQKETQLQNKMNAYQQMLTDVDNKTKAGTITELERQQSYQALTEMEQDIQSFRLQASLDFQKKRLELMSPIEEQALNAIKAVAAENGYTYVFDITQGHLLYYPEEADITTLVQAKL